MERSKSPSRSLSTARTLIYEKLLEVYEMLGCTYEMQIHVFHGFIVQVHVIMDKR